MAIQYFGKAKNFDKIERKVAAYFVGIGSEYISKSGVRYECIQNSPSGEFDVLCAAHYFIDGNEVYANIMIPKVLFFKRDFFGW